MKGPLIILSGPAGSGKTTVLARLLASKDLPLHRSVSATTRAPRDGESDGVHYHFWDRTRFEKAVADGEFLESAEVHGNRYGTLRREVTPYRDKGIGVILEIDVQGAEQVRRQCPEAVAVFLQTSAWKTYEERLRKRGTETEESIQRRVAGAKTELARAVDYDYQITNDDLDTAVSQFHEIVRRQFEGGKHAG